MPFGPSQDRVLGVGTTHDLTRRNFRGQLLGLQCQMHATSGDSRTWCSSQIPERYSTSWILFSQLLRIKSRVVTAAAPKSAGGACSKGCSPMHCEEAQFI